MNTNQSFNSSSSSKKELSRSHWRISPFWLDFQFQCHWSWWLLFNAEQGNSSAPSANFQWYLDLSPRITCSAVSSSFWLPLWCSEWTKLTSVPSTRSSTVWSLTIRMMPWCIGASHHVSHFLSLVSSIRTIGRSYMALLLLASLVLSECIAFYWPSTSMQTEISTLSQSKTTLFQWRSLPGPYSLSSAPFLSQL